ncbi:MAG: SIS domain-containing protein [Erysipelotrichaceae bacterium]|nr:SIS domain-containing protein [Erysipelotrichaceae bacterium]
MDRKNYDNSLLRQSLRLEEYVNIVYRNVLPQVNKIPVKEIWDAQKIFITGCGDSWLAGIAAKPAFESITKKETYAIRAIEFSRILNNKNLGYSPNTPLVILISFSGTASRVIEGAKRAVEHGANTIAITANPDSPLAKTCHHCIDVGLPKDGEYQPGLITYNASMLTLFMIALRIGRVRNSITPLEYESMHKELLDYTSRCQKEVEGYAERAFEIAQKWKDLKAEDFIGDYADFATAYFGSAKVIECFGGYTTYDDSEDWCHINYFLLEPEKIGRVVTVNKTTPSFGRVLETIDAVKILKSPCMIVTDANKSEFPEDMEVFTVPSAKYFWMHPFMQHIPFDLVAGYIGELKGVKSFRQDDPKYNTDICNNRLKSGTEIKII